ncbi:MAG: hypothetical protein WBM13_09935, partial [Bacteroidia bacterium]
MKKLLLLFSVFIYFQSFAQTVGNMLYITQQNPLDLTICGPSKEFKVTIYNPTPWTITSCSLSVTTPTGVQFDNSCPVPGFINNFGGVIKINLPNIAPLQTIEVKFCLKAQCNVRQFIAGGGIIRNNVRVDYIANTMPRFDSNLGSTYIIRQPNVTITSVTNQSFNGTIGQTFNRCITIVNGGSGALASFTFTDLHATGVQITAIDKGVWTTSGQTEKVELNGTQFITVGDGDALFESGESITICETVHILNCISATSNFRAFWGCSVNSCQASDATANVVFPNYVPNLIITPTAFMNSCMGPGNASPQQLRIVNSGTGTAINVMLDIAQSVNNGFNNGLGSRIDETSFTRQIGSNGATTSITPTVTQTTSGLNCMNNATGRVTINISQINAGDTLFIKWNTFCCCYNSCNNTGNNAINGWRYKSTYSNICQTNYFTNETWGRVPSEIYGALAPDGAPSTLSNGQNGTFTFLFSNYNNTYPIGPGAHWRFVFKLPPYGCVNYSNIRIIHSNGTSIWTPNTVTSAGDSVVAIFNGGAPFNLTHAELKINLSLVCSACVGTEILTQLSVKSFYIPDSGCGCRIGVSCQTIPFNINCPDPCPAGIMFANFDLQRTSYGFPDNEAGGGNGVPDGSGSLNFNKIKTNRVMFGDTITTGFYVVANTNMSNPTLPFVYAKSSISNGNLFGFIDAQLKIYRSNSLLLTCNNITPSATTNGSTRDFLYDLSESSLACLSTYDYTDKDSLVLICRYKDTSNIGNVTPINCFSTNRFYSSAIANPTQITDQLQCGTINGNCTVIGYFFENHTGENYATQSCNNVTVSQNYYLSVGPTWNNDAGGNLFPFEYRNWAHIQKITATIPSGYTYVSAKFRDVRTAGTLGTSNSGWVSVNPTNANSDTLEFDLEPQFSGYGGSIPLSDDGFYGTLEITLQPGCEVVPDTYDTVTHNIDFSATSYISGPGSAPATSYFRNDDKIIYDAPDLNLQATLPSIMALDSLETWEIIISNTSNNSNASNLWISAPQISGVNIIKVEDADNNVNVPKSGEMFQVGTVLAMGVRKFRLIGNYTSCGTDSIKIYVGWNCSNGYPDNINQYPCAAKTITLTLTPIYPAFEIYTQSPQTPLGLCDTATIIATGKNIQLGTGYNITLTTYLPQGVIIIPNSCELSYPLNNPYVSISDPVALGNNQYKWNISTANGTIGSDGLKGLLDTALNNFNIRFKVSTACGYVSGSKFNFSISGKAACGFTTDFQLFESAGLEIIGLNQPYATSVNIVTTYVSPCATNSGIKLVVHNLGPTNFGSTDSVSFKLPTGVSFIPGSFTAVHNAPPNGVPVLSTIGGADYLTWRLPAGVVAGDSSVFHFQFAGEPVLLSCGIVFFEASTKSSSIITCTSTGQGCQSNIITGDTLLPVFIYKAYLQFSNGYSSSIPNPPSGETVTLTFDITNLGQAIEINADSVIQYYFDADGDSVYSVGDVFITQDTVLVPEDSTITYTTTFNVPAGQACAILAVVDPGINNCVCDPTQLISYSRGLSSLGNDTTICSGATMTMSYPPVTGYTYAWTPTTDLNDGTQSDAILTGSNLTTNPISTTYSLATNRIGCNGNDTIIVTVKPLPTATITGATTVCENATSPSITFTGAVGESPYTFIYSKNGFIDTVISAADTSMIPVSTDSAGTYLYTLISVQDSSIATCAQTINTSVTVVVNPLPEATAQIVNFSDICQGGASPIIAFIGANGVAPYTFTYNIDGNTNQTVISTNGDTAFISAPTNIPGTFTYHIVSIQDASITTCLQNQDDSISVTINPLPTAIISGNSIVCREADSPIIEFIGTVGTAPFTFNYTVDGTPAPPVTSTNGDTAYVLAPTNIDGTFVYALTGVTDSSSTTCYQAQTGSVTIIVEPLPTATIHGSTTVCQHAIQPTVTFIGNGGVPPYTFEYNINGLPQVNLTTTNNSDSISILVPTSDSGNFVYSLVSVTDANVVACTHPQTGDVTIIVNPKVNVAFTADSVCNGNPTVFSDASTTASGTLTSWSWDLG